MSTNLSNRTFRLWEYRVSHSQLLIRSPKHQQFPTNVDIIFAGVEYLELPIRWENLSIGEGTEEEINEIRVLLKRNMPHSKMYILHEGETRFKVVAAGMKVFENELDMFESSLESFNT